MIAPTSLLRKVDAAAAPCTPPTRPKNADVRPREWLDHAEVTALMQAAKASGRYGPRDATMILLAYRHGLRVSELVALRWSQIGWQTSHVSITRLKGGSACVHRLSGVELRALRALKRQWPASAYVFLTERGGPMTADQFRNIVSRAGRAAGFPFPVHPHMLRHACGYTLVNQGEDTRAIQDYLGHRNIRHTERYTKLNVKRFDRFWQD